MTIEKYPLIEKGGSIVLDRYVVCDGYHSGAAIHVVTHSHLDHLKGIKESLKQKTILIMTQATKDLIEAIYRRKIKGNILTIPYEYRFILPNDEIVLCKADHIIGAAQVLYRKRNKTILYTGDFRLPGTPIVNAEILITEATYGLPNQNRPPVEDIKKALIELVEKYSSETPVYIYGFHGKLQEVMELLRKEGIKNPFVTHEKVYNITRICIKHGMKIDNVFLDSSKEGRRILKEKQYIYFAHTSFKEKIRKNCCKVTLTGWEFREKIRKISNFNYIVALSDHSDFRQLIEYIKECKPKKVIIDACRSNSARVLAKYIIRNLNIKAIAMP